METIVRTIWGGEHKNGINAVVEFDGRSFAVTMRQRPAFGVVMVTTYDTKLKVAWKAAIAAISRGFY